MSNTNNDSASNADQQLNQNDNNSLSDAQRSIAATGGFTPEQQQALARVFQQTLAQVFQPERIFHQLKQVNNQTMKSNQPARMFSTCLLYTSPSPRDGLLSRMPSSA